MLPMVLNLGSSSSIYMIDVREKFQEKYLGKGGRLLKLSIGCLQFFLDTMGQDTPFGGSTSPRSKGVLKNLS